MPKQSHISVLSYGDKHFIEINIDRRQPYEIIACEASWKNRCKIEAPEIRAYGGTSSQVNFFDAFNFGTAREPSKVIK